MSVKVKMTKMRRASSNVSTPIVDLNEIATPVFMFILNQRSNSICTNWIVATSLILYILRRATNCVHVIVSPTTTANFVGRFFVSSNKTKSCTNCSFSTSSTFSNSSLTSSCNIFFDASRMGSIWCAIYGWHHCCVWTRGCCKDGCEWVGAVPVSAEFF